VRDLFFRRSVEEGTKGGVRDAPVTRVGAFISDAVDGVDDECVGGFEVGGERGGFELSETVPTGEVSTKVDAVGEGSLLHEEKERADGGIGNGH
jgi:hypothetical protein